MMPISNDPLATADPTYFKVELSQDVNGKFRKEK